MCHLKCLPWSHYKFYHAFNVHYILRLIQYLQGLYLNSLSFFLSFIFYSYHSLFLSPSLQSLFMCVISIKGYKKKKINFLWKDLFIRHINLINTVVRASFTPMKMHWCRVSFISNNSIQYMCHLVAKELTVKLEECHQQNVMCWRSRHENRLQFYFYCHKKNSYHFDSWVCGTFISKG